MKHTDLEKKLDEIKTELQAVLNDKKALKHDYFKLEKAHRALDQANRTLQIKHEKVCSDVKTLKGEKELLTKKLRALQLL